MASGTEPLAVAGVVIGGASLTIQLVAEAVRGFRILKEAAGAEESHEYCRLLVQIEYNKLEDWALASNLDADKESDFDIHVHRDETINRTLTQLEQALKRLRYLDLEYEGLEKRSQSTEVPNDVEQRKISDLSEPGIPVEAPQPSQLRQKLEIAQSHRFAQIRKEKFARRCVQHLRSGWNGTKKVLKEPRRFKWALKDEAVFEKHFKAVQELVQSLTETLSRDQMKIVAENQQLHLEMLLQVSATVGEVRSLLLATRNSAFLAGTTLVGDSADAAVQFWASAAQFSVDAGDIDLTKIEPQPQEQLAVGRESSSWVEFKSYAPIFDESTGRRIVDHETMNRVKKLVALLKLSDKPAEFCMPPCLGFFQDADNTRFGLVFAPPKGVDSAPKTLLDLFSEGNVTLTARMTIAQKLAQWLLCFHTVNWLHKGLRSINILFFPSQHASHFGQPYVGGYEFSRSAFDEKASMPPPDEAERRWYTHPSYYESQRGYRKTYDIYSLGVILVELAYWKPIGRIMQPVEASSGKIDQTADDQAQEGASEEQELPIRVAHQTTQKAAIPDIREALLDPKRQYLREIENKMGVRYMRATQACLDGANLLSIASDADQSNIEVGAALRQAFVDIVVEPLKSIQV